MPEEPKRDALQLIFSFFLGVLLVVFVGVGVYTFYPGPDTSDDETYQQLEELRRDQERVWNKERPAGLSEAEQAEIDSIQEEIDELQEVLDEKREVWGRNTSIVLIVFATVLMGVSLVLPDRMRVISNGVLLGGLFSIVYGTGWSFVGGDSIARFSVVSVAVLLTLAFGYIRFVARRGDSHEGAAVSADGPRSQ